MKQLVRLCTPEACIEINVSNEQWQWCRCTLVYSDTLYHLGAETLNNITRQLLHVLSSSWEELTNPVAGQINGHEVKVALALSEEHSTMYVATDGTYQLLFLEDKEGNLIYTIPLLPKERLEWQTQLKMLAVNTNPK